MKISMALLFLCSLNTFTAAGSDNPTATGDVSINCGSIGPSEARNGREWLGDEQIKGSSSVIIYDSNISADPVPYKSARLSRSPFSYTFQLNRGQKIIRLHFNPVSYRGFKRFNDLFTVEAGNFTLLSNFSASLTADALRVKSYYKEFCLNIQEYQQLSITFSPESSKLQDTYAFINGIEIISVPSVLSYYPDRDIGVQVVGKSLVYVDYNTAFEIIHRRNFEQRTILPSGDFDGLFPMWATRKAKEIQSNTWKISVDVGFRYLIRLHFSEHGLKLVETGNMIFKVLINGIIAQTNADILKERDDNEIPRYRDYMVMMKGHKQDGKRGLLISLQLYDESTDGHELLTGFEVLKISNPDNSLASPNPSFPKFDSPSQTLKTLFSLGHRNAIATVLITTIVLLNIIVHKLRQVWEASSNEEENKPSARAERFCRRFSLDEIELATKNFSYALIIGKGGFGNVYKGLIDNGQETVAIKRLKLSSRQGAHEFLTEIETLSELRHVNLVSLIGYCNEHGEMILVYEYVACGTLADHLYKHARDSNNNNSSLSWKQRLNICIGAGRGLDYLHTGHRLIHRDVKSSNILLDENFEAKVSDFGLAKPEDRSKLQSHVSTNVKGTPGYWDPSYVYTRKLTRKSDSYAFGVVLMEVLCGRPAVDRRVAEDERILSKWARDKISKGEVDQIVASSLKEEISPDSLKTFVGIAERCLDDEPKKRPTMSQVVLQLETVLEQQQENKQIPAASVSDDIHPCNDEPKQRPTISQVVLQLETVLEQQENKQLLVPNETASVSDDIHPCNDETNIPANTGQLAMASKDVQNLTHSTKGQNGNTEPLYARKATTYKPSRLWPWDTFRSIFKPVKRNELLLSELFAVNVKLRHFDWASIAAATNQFSSANKVGEGGFGPVYKAMLPTGEVIAVKRFRESSGHRVEEFKNEILLLPNLQHRNIIKLLGYCIHREEKLLVYEFMDNKGLDSFIGQCQLLEWTLRLKIIMGISRGVVYLHQDSGMKLIHRDLKPGNILLDAEMNPKISDFSLARTLNENLTELSTRICGTWSYISPEYICSGRISVKCDVYSFGVIVLEIISGRRSLKRNHEYVHLVEYAWKLWSEGKVLDLVDESLGGAFPAEEALRCIQVGLLCTQELPHNRPEMPSVVKMLEGEEILVEPQEPWPRGVDLERSSSIHTSGVDSDTTFEYDETTQR